MDRQSDAPHEHELATPTTKTSNQPTEATTAVAAATIEPDVPAQAPAPVARTAGSSTLPKPGRIPLQIRKKIEAAYAWQEDDWPEIETFFEARVAELKPDRDSLYLKALEIACCDKDLLHYNAHAGRLLRLARGQAVREILKPGYSEMAFGGRSYGKLDPMKGSDAYSVHHVMIDGEINSLEDHNDPEIEAILEGAAVAKLKSMGLSDKGIATKAFELRLEPLQAIQRQMALTQARRDQLLASYIRESAIAGELLPPEAA